MFVCECECVCVCVCVCVCIKDRNRSSASVGAVLLIMKIGGEGGICVYAYLLANWEVRLIIAQQNSISLDHMITHVAVLE